MLPGLCLMPLSLIATERATLISHRIAPGSFFLLLTLMHLRQLRAFIQLGEGQQETLPHVVFFLSLAHRFAGILFLGTIAVLMVVRLVPVGKSQGGTPPGALLGTFLMGTVALFPQRDHSVGRSLMAGILLLSGTLFATFAAIVLGRSFSIMPEARRLVMAGPYSMVRHPIYLGEILGSAGLVVGSRSLGALVIYLVFVFLQIQRIRYEEAPLSRVFPEYEEYRRRTARLVRRFTDAQPGVR